MEGGGEGGVGGGGGGGQEDGRVKRHVSKGKERTVREGEEGFFFF